MTTTTTHHISWLDAGWLSTQPHASAWTLLAAALLTGVLVVAISYAFALVRVDPFRRAVLIVLRLALLLGLLAILAAPMRVEETYSHPSGPRPLAVLVDQSGSMTAADNRGHRRLDDALQKWQRLQPAAAHTFPAVKSFAFATGMTPLGKPTDRAHLPDSRTDLFASLEHALAHAPTGGWSGIVSLTDGLDTSGIEIAEAERATVHAALLANTPLYFVIGRNRTIEPPYFHLREFTAPADALPHTIIHLEAVFESYRNRAATIPLQFTVNGQAQPTGGLTLDPGRHIEHWSADYPANVPGTLEVDLRAGTQLARAEVRVIAPRELSRRILYYEGALDWGYRFLTDILRRDDTFSVTPVFDFPNGGIALPPGALAHPPFTPAGLKPYAIVILANAAATQIPQEQQEALTQWVNDGGVLLFLTPDDDSAQGFAGSELERMLPVVFPSGGSSATPSDGGPIRIQIGNPARAYTAAHALELTPFAWEDSPLVRQIFAPTPDASLQEETPRFSTSAHVARAKPAAEVLARNPAETGLDGQGNILLAVETYGAGKSVVFTTDALWRWKLSEASTARGTELFWENLFSWLTKDRRPPDTLRFDHPPVASPIDTDVTLRLLGAPAGAPVLVEAALGGRRVPAAELPAEGGTHVFRLRLNAPGLWRIAAASGENESAHAWLSVDQSKPLGELSGASPDENLLGNMAAETGGAVIEDTPPTAWTYRPPAAQLVLERKEPLWHRSWIFGSLLGLYGLELLLRRRWNLL